MFYIRNNYNFDENHLRLFIPIISHMSIVSCLLFEGLKFRYFKLVSLYSAIFLVHTDISSVNYHHISKCVLQHNDS